MPGSTPRSAISPRHVPKSPHSRARWRSSKASSPPSREQKQKSLKGGLGAERLPARQPLFFAHPHRGRMPRQLHALDWRDLASVDLENGQIGIKVVANVEIFSVRRERGAFRQSANFDLPSCAPA